MAIASPRATNQMDTHSSEKLAYSSPTNSSQISDNDSGRTKMAADPTANDIKRKGTTRGKIFIESIGKLANSWQRAKDSDPKKMAEGPALDGTKGTVKGVKLLTGKIGKIFKFSRRANESDRKEKAKKSGEKGAYAIEMGGTLTQLKRRKFLIGQIEKLESNFVSVIGVSFAVTMGIYASIISVRGTNNSCRVAKFITALLSFVLACCAALLLYIIMYIMRYRQLLAVQNKRAEAEVRRVEEGDTKEGRGRGVEEGDPEEVRGVPINSKAVDADSDESFDILPLFSTVQTRWRIFFVGLFILAWASFNVCLYFVNFLLLCRH